MCPKKITPRCLPSLPFNSEYIVPLAPKYKIHACGHWKRLSPVSGHPKRQSERVSSSRRKEIKASNILLDFDSQ